MTAIDETLIVKISCLGMPFEGIGVRGLAAKHNADPREVTEEFMDQITEAFKEALRDAQPKIAKYLEEKYRVE